ncbi:hypothetical protein WJU23_09315 [Prosthecobacter sp. SYSU 5D2]|uniref:hypothetical protein n=1 Tax=Prosthecobacter sp. SYSU 5D2 TaxID=3134134 RepID=UPI0031FF439E
MNPDNVNDPDLQQRFQAQRRCERAEAPAWDPRLLTSPASVRNGPSWRLWLPVTAAAALALGIFIPQPPDVPPPRLSEALPPLLDAPAHSLFASLNAAPASAPSDFLLPAYLTLQMP